MTDAATETLVDRIIGLVNAASAMKESPYPGDDFSELKPEIADLLTTQSALIETLTRERDEARGLVVEANNSLYGSQGYFHSINGGSYNRHHLADGIETLKWQCGAAEAALADEKRDHAKTAEQRASAFLNAQAAEDKANTAIRSLSECATKLKAAEADVNMYAKAWEREIGPPYAAKRHHIDAMVITTQRVREQANRVPSLLKRIAELEASEETKRLDAEYGSRAILKALEAKDE